MSCVDTSHNGTHFTPRSLAANDTDETLRVLSLARAANTDAPPVDLNPSGQPSGLLLNIFVVGVANSGNYGHANAVSQAAASKATSVAIRDTAGC